MWCFAAMGGEQRQIELTVCRKSRSPPPRARTGTNQQITRPGPGDLIILGVSRPFRPDRIRPIPRSLPSIYLCGASLGSEINKSSTSTTWFTTLRVRTAERAPGAAPQPTRPRSSPTAPTQLTATEEGTRHAPDLTHAAGHAGLLVGVFIRIKIKDKIGKVCTTCTAMMPCLLSIPNYFMRHE
jgi:hypothetical protein